MSTFRVASFVVSLINLGRIGSGQSFGGSPPWGPEQPVSMGGELRAGQTFKNPIGDGLSLILALDGDEWDIEVTPSVAGDDYSRCVNPPFHGPNAKQIMAWHFQSGRKATPGGVGEKRWIDFVLSAKDHRMECANLEIALQGKDTAWGSHISGRCWFRPVSVKLGDGILDQQVIESLKFEAACALHGAWELWRLPSTYVIDDGFTGWVTVYYREKGKAELSRSGDRYVLPVAGSTNVHTSSDLRQDSRGAKFVWTDGRSISAAGVDRMIWGWQVGDADMCSPFQSFFVGTSDQYRKAGKNPALKSPVWDCDNVLRFKR
jgi:hypothetical protein